MQNNTAIVNAEPKTAPLQLPEETETLIKASIAENTLKAYQRALQSLTVWLAGRTLSDALLANYITVLHDNRQIPGNDRASRRCCEVAIQAPITGIRQLPDHASNISRHPQSRAKTEGAGK